MIQHKPLVPAGGAKPVGPYVPGLDAGDYVYVSGQGASDGEGHRAPDIESQTRQAMTNVRLILEAAGLGLADVVQVQFYLLDLKHLDTANRVYLGAYAAGGDPPRVILGTRRMPTDTPVEITVVARKRGVAPRRIYLPAVYGTNRADAERQLKEALSKLGLNPTHLHQRIDYSTGPWQAGTVAVNALPNGAHHAILAMASAQPEASATFCAVVASEPKGSVEEQTRDAFARLNSCLAKSGFSLAHVTATNVYLNNMDDFAKMNAEYAAFFPGGKPTRTTVQPAQTIDGGSLVRISAFAVL
jgi:2-iminobutanoate/2-iminopropanoate deaminase